MTFSMSVKHWQQDQVSVSEESISDAAQWLSGLKAEGNSYLLLALKVKCFGYLAS